MKIFTLFLNDVVVHNSDGIIETLISEIVSGSIIAVLLLVCIYLGWNLYNRDKKIDKMERNHTEDIKELVSKHDAEKKELNEYIRENEKENMSILNEVNNTLDRVLENQKNANTIVISKIEDLKELIKDKKN